MPPLIGEPPERLLDVLMSHTPAGIVVVSAPDLTVRMVSRTAARLFGRDVAEMLGQPVAGELGRYTIRREGGAQPACFDDLPIARASRRGEVIAGEEWMIESSSGARLNFLINSAPVRDASGLVVGAISAWTDISRRKAVETALRVALENESLLVREINHRIKNHFQIVMGIIEMEISGLGDEAAEFARSVLGRLSALAAAQAGTYSSESLGTVKAGLLLSGIAQALTTPLHPVSVNAEEDVELTDGQVTPVSLAVNEAVSNALKHAFPGGRPGAVSVGLRRVGGLVAVTVADDGVGLAGQPRDGSLGLRILGVLARQLNGRFDLADRPGGGTLFTLDFPQHAA